MPKLAQFQSLVICEIFRVHNWAAACENVTTSMSQTPLFSCFVGMGQAVGPHDTWITTDSSSNRAFYIILLYVDAKSTSLFSPKCIVSFADPPDEWSLQHSQFTPLPRILACVHGKQSNVRTCPFVIFEMICTRFVPWAQQPSSSGKKVEHFLFLATRQKSQKVPPRHWTMS